MLLLVFPQCRFKPVGMFWFCSLYVNTIVIKFLSKCRWGVNVNMLSTNAVCLLKQALFQRAWQLIRDSMHPEQRAELGFIFLVVLLSLTRKYFFFKHLLKSLTCIRHLWVWFGGWLTKQILFFYLFLFLLYLTVPVSHLVYVKKNQSLRHY